MIPYLATFNPNQNETGDHFFSLFLFVFGDMKSKWEGRNKRGGIKCIIKPSTFALGCIVFYAFF
jgi:hypothetical protein